MQNTGAPWITLLTDCGADALDALEALSRAGVMHSDRTWIVVTGGDKAALRAKEKLVEDVFGKNGPLRTFLGEFSDGTANDVAQYRFHPYRTYAPEQIIALGPVRELHTKLAEDSEYFRFTVLYISKRHATDELLDAFKAAYVCETAAEVASKYCDK